MKYVPLYVFMMFCESIFISILILFVFYASDVNIKFNINLSFSQIVSVTFIIKIILANFVHFVSIMENQKSKKNEI
jgi:hypothetical protein